MHPSNRYGGRRRSQDTPLMETNATPTHPKPTQLPPSSESNNQIQLNSKKQLQSLLTANKAPEHRQVATVDTVMSILAFLIPLLRNEDQLLAYFKRFEERVFKEIQNTPQQVPVTSPRTWASVAARGHARQFPAKSRPGNQANSTAFTIRPTNTTKESLRSQTNMAVLQEVRKTIPEAAAVRHLTSGDIRVYVTTAGAKEAIIKKRDALGERLGARILR
ncbi:hypothetical protein GQ43DRAFT_3877 [Delitschia confertaspora ATCC 74209]|uniref:Uncharacterized protein n=1 Tax=Delitschia confertaspora ATCC 74209 TaxID=1513339 RepID=A0A9P4MW66_9PLEO|nr:hypothetical protein GQ43DRAFT_3877 [Delitschia confertaspora ATCC 74209]